MGGKKTPKVPVVDYYLSVQFALGHGPMDSINRIVVKEKEAWRGRATGGPITVDKKDLFGGNKKEGGVAGVVEFLPGGPDQVVPEYLATRFGRTSAEMPAYRGVASCFFTDGKSVSGRKRAYSNADIKLDGKGGFMWSSNNPYLPDTWINATRVPKTPLASGIASIDNLVPEAIIGLPEEPEEGEDDDDDEDEEEVPDAENEDPLNGYYLGELPDEETFIKTKFGYKATVDSLNADPTFTRRIFDVENQNKLKIAGAVYRNYGKDANPAHLIMEAMMDPVWGMGASETSFNVPSFTACALKLYAEKFGLTVFWSEQSKVEDIVSEILDHVQGMVFVNPRDGLITMRLLRNDYDEATLRVVSPDNANLTSFSRKSWGDTINEIVVTWTNPENEKDSTVTLQDLANIAIQGSIVSDSRNYHGIRNASLALQVCARDLRSASTPTAQMEGTLDRSLWDVLPGDVVKVVWPEEGIEGAVFRVMEPDYGRIGDSSIKVKLVEDIFSLPTQNYTMPVAPRPSPDGDLAEPLDYVSGFTLPYQLARRYGLADPEIEYPSVGVAILGATNNTAIDMFDVKTHEATTTGTMTLVDQGTFGLTTHILLPQGLPKEFSSSLAALSGETNTRGSPQVGGLIIIGNGDLAEIGVFTAVTESGGGVTFARGMLDTVPRSWPANTPAWIIDYATFDSLDDDLRTALVAVDYRILPRTNTDRLDDEDYQPLTFTPSERPYLPSRPANCQAAGEAFSKVYATSPAPGATVALTWANRNRLMEDAVFPIWTQGNVAPETGQTTRIICRDENGEELGNYPNLSGTSFNLPLDGLSGLVYVYFYAEREGFRSLQAYRVALDLPYEIGYGASYGKGYGG